jgi:hypothetical protein
MADWTWVLPEEGIAAARDQNTPFQYLCQSGCYRRNPPFQPY